MSKKLSTQEKARKAWVLALMSGKYRHTRETLHNPSQNSYCCLGVACVIAEKHGIKVYRQDGRLAGDTLNSQPLVKDWLGIKHDDGAFDVDNLASINDSANRNPFKRIAKIIASNPEGLFVEDSE